MKKLIIAIDFDGTVVTHEYPRIGEDIGAVPVLKRITDAGHRIVLWTMRDGAELLDAVNWYKDNEIPLYGVNETPGQTMKTNKAYADFYIDDRAIGCPMKYESSKGLYIDWVQIEHMLESASII